MKNKKKYQKIINYLLVAVSLMIMAIIVINKNSQNDLFFDLKTGESILKNGIDFLDHFSFIPNLTYMYHHYLYDLIIYGIYHLFSYTGIFLFFLTIITLLSFALYYVNYKISNSKIYALILTFVTLWLCSPFLSNRVQTITYLLFSLELYLLTKFYSTGKTKYMILILLDSILIANIHMPFWAFTIVLSLPFVVEALLANIKIPFINPNITFEKCKDGKKFIILFILLLLSGLVSPLKLYPYIFFIKALGNKDFLFINEMAQTVPIVNFFFLYTLVLGIVTPIFVKGKIRFRDLALIGGLSLFSLMAVRNSAYVYLVFPTLIGYIICSNYKFSLKKVRVPKILKSINYPLLSTFVLGILIVIYYSSLSFLHVGNYDYKITEDYPVKLVKYYKEHYDYKNLKIFNEFNFGSYLEFNDIPVFIDSRAEVYIKSFNGGYDIVGDFLKAKKYLEYKNIFNKYNFDCAIIYNDSDLYKYLINDKDYRLVYTENDTFSLFEKANVKIEKNT